MTLFALDNSEPRPDTGPKTYSACSQPLQAAVHSACNPSMDPEPGPRRLLAPDAEGLTAAAIAYGITVDNSGASVKKANMWTVIGKSPAVGKPLKLRRGTKSGDQFEKDVGPYSTRNTSKGSLLRETHLVFRALASGNSLEEVRTACLAGKLLRQSARETRHRIWELLHWRFFAWNPPKWVIEDLVDACMSDVTAPQFIGLVYVHYIRRDHLTFDFVTDRLSALWNAGIREVSRHDVIDFLVENINGDRVKWRESTRTKLAGNVLSALRDFGLLTGVQKKRIQRPVVPPEVALHLCRLLEAEGLRGRAVLDARDWHAFLWNFQDTSQSLAQLAQRGDILFERSGATVVLELPKRSPRGGR